ncbi:MAG: hypothetical protein KatS3mg038_2129 [Candidatus Kapaibacterium sp.]|nr:MAG: hypothetical protein KatS3mg038_0789 [Candidatus Kapabacteria bacterium]GIV51375.1 MAG: hypothetical protein KatS3mg038_1896 [Candidatus Kapabacteria bacterium]GIV51608.1 MAG: hypothetical protein KatS3mg038_2129 [Candidatus Kapabacteria bacterium]
MANEIRITLSMAVNNGALRETISEQLALDQASAQGPTPGFVVVGTTAEQISFGDVATPGYAYLKNLDTVNYVQIGVVVSAVFYPLMRLNAGEAAIVPWDSGAVVYAKANAAPVPMVIKTFAR